MDEQLIREQFKRSGLNISRTARVLDIDIDVARLLLQDDIQPSRKPTIPKPADIRQLGKIGLRRWVVAVRAANEPEWPDEYRSAIHQARRRYDAGTHEMFQGFNEGWFVLYSMERKWPTEPRPYFFQRTQRSEATMARVAS